MAQAAVDGQEWEKVGKREEEQGPELGDGVGKGHTPQGLGLLLM